MRIRNGGQGLSFVMPAYNAQDFLEESVLSIMEGNFYERDELVIVDDGSTDSTLEIIQKLGDRYPGIVITSHSRNKGTSAARNTAVEIAKNDLIFCLDADNILYPGSVFLLRRALKRYGVDAISFRELRFFQDSITSISHKWKFKAGRITLADCLAGNVNPCCSGNYLYTKESWEKAGGYPEFALGLDAWGFGIRQLASGSQMMVVRGTFYYHRVGHESLWVRESKKGMISLIALQVLIPFLHLIVDEDVDYIMGREGRNTWFENLESRPLHLKSGEMGRTGKAITPEEYAKMLFKGPLLEKPLLWARSRISYYSMGKSR